MLDVTVLRFRAQLEAMRGRFDAARDLIAEAKTLAEELGLKTILAAGVARSAGEIELLAGDPEAAERELRPACEALSRRRSLPGAPTISISVGRPSAISPRCSRSPARETRLPLRWSRHSASTSARATPSWPSGRRRASMLCEPRRDCRISARGRSPDGSEVSAARAPCEPEVFACPIRTRPRCRSRSTRE